MPPHHSGTEPCFHGPPIASLAGPETLRRVSDDAGTANRISQVGPILLPEFKLPVESRARERWSRVSDRRSACEAVEFQALTQSLAVGEVPGAGALRPVNDVVSAKPATDSDASEPGHVIAKLA